MNEAQLHRAVADVLRPSRFHVQPGRELRFDGGKILLDGSCVVSIELSRADSRLHVRRHIAMRSAVHPVLTETVGTIDISRSDLETPLARCVEMALAGGSRLAIASHETALPAFLLGQIGFVSDESRRIEFLLRSSRTDAEIGDLAASLRDRADLDAMFRWMFNRLALSPYTCLVDNLVRLVRRIGGDFAIDTIGYMLRHLVRHLTAFDLLRFHNGGANYPDALMLDALLAAYVDAIRAEPAKFAGPAGRVRRRALRQAWMVRRQYEGHAVPDAPTSPGDAQRLWPGELPTSSRGGRRLYEGSDSNALVAGIDDVVRWCREDLDVAEERRESGMATFLDRPLGLFKRPGEPDRTPLLSYEAFSRRVAEARLREFRDGGLVEGVNGVPAARLAGHSREGVVALEDAKKVSMDFVFTRTTRSSLDELLSQYDWPANETVDWLRTSNHVLLVRTPGLNPSRAMLSGFDASMTLRVEMSPAEESSPRYVEHAGVEYFAEGLKIRSPDGMWKIAPPAT